jgi:hypothetical protein
MEEYYYSLYSTVNVGNNRFESLYSTIRLSQAMFTSLGDPIYIGNTIFSSESTYLVDIKPLFAWAKDAKGNISDKAVTVAMLYGEAINTKDTL